MTSSQSQLFTELHIPYLSADLKIPVLLIKKSEGKYYKYLVYITCMMLQCRGPADRCHFHLDFLPKIPQN